MISFTCEPVIAHWVHAPSPSGRISEPGFELDQGGKMGIWKAVAKHLQNTLGKGNMKVSWSQKFSLTLVERERTASRIALSNTVATCHEQLCPWKLIKVN